MSEKELEEKRLLTAHPPDGKVAELQIVQAPLAPRQHHQQKRDRLRRTGAVRAARFSAKRPGLCFDLCCCCLCNGYHYPEEGACCQRSCFMLNDQASCEFCPCKCCQCRCGDLVCVFKRISLILFILLLLLVVVGWFFIVTETVREERVQLVLCIQNSTTGVSIHLWDSKLTDSTFFSPLRREEHANMTMQLHGSGLLQGASFRSPGQYLWRVEPGVECLGGIQLVLTSSNSSSYLESYSPIEWVDREETLRV